LTRSEAIRRLVDLGLKAKKWAAPPDCRWSRAAEKAGTSWPELGEIPRESINREPASL